MTEDKNKTSQVCLYRSEVICLKHERSWLICPTTEVVRLSPFIHSDRADCLENMKELPYVQWLKVWKVRCLSEWTKNALYEQNVLSSHGLHRSTFGDERLNYRVRNGIGWSLSLWFRSYKAFSLYEPNIWSYQVTSFYAPWRLHSVMGKNHESKRNNQDKELDQLVLLAWNPYKSYSCSLSTS